MKKFTLILIGLMAIAMTNAATFPYDYNTFFAAGATGSGVLETGTSGILNTWYNGATTTGSNPTLITPSTLSYTDGTSANYIDNNAGKAVYINSPTAARNSIFYLNSTGYTSGTYYVSYLINVTAGTAPASPTQIMNFNQSSTGSSAYGRMYISQSSSNGFVFTINSYNGTASSASPELSYGTTHLIILKFVMSASPASAQAFLFTDPTLGGTEGTPTITAPAYTTGALTVKGLVIMSIASLNAKIAGLRLSTTWADAAKAASVAPPLSVPTGINTTSISSTGFSASWTVVTNASSYNVKTYIGGTNLVSTTPVPSGTSTTVSGLMSGLDYSYKVAAVGDGVINGDSPESSAQSFTTTGRVASFITDFSDVVTWGTPLASVPATGTYGPATTVNGFDLNAAALTVTTVKGPKGESHTNRISMDKLSAGGSVTLPTITSVGQLEIHFAMGTAANTINLKEYNTSTNSWTLVGSYAYDAAYKTAGLDQIIIVPFATPHTNAKFKIENNTSGSCYLVQIVARATNPSLLTAPLVGTASAITATTCTANWTPVDANGTNYQVSVYKVITSSTVPGLKTETTTLKATATTTGGQATSIVAITGLQADSTYIFKVKAIGDGDVNFSDSYQTVSSAQFTMAHQLATPTVGTANTSATGITANWTNPVVTNVLSYDVNVYQGTTLVKTVNVADPNATSVNINGLQYATEYTFTVTAIGDNSTYYNSAESAKSTPATTDIGTGLVSNDNSFRLYLNNKEIICSETGNIDIYNLQGVKVLEANKVNKLFANLNSGMYMIRFTNQKGQTLLNKLLIK